MAAQKQNTCLLTVTSACLAVEEAVNMNVLVCWLSSLITVISTFVGYLMPKLNLMLLVLFNPYLRR